MLDRFGQIGSYRLFSIKTASRLFNIADGHGVRGCGFLSFSDFTATKPVGVEGDCRRLRQPKWKSCSCYRSGLCQRSCDSLRRSIRNSGESHYILSVGILANSLRRCDRNCGGFQYGDGCWLVWALRRALCALRNNDLESRNVCAALPSWGS